MYVHCFLVLTLKVSLFSCIQTLSSAYFQFFFSLAYSHTFFPFTPYMYICPVFLMVLWVFVQRFVKTGQKWHLKRQQNKRFFFRGSFDAFSHTPTTKLIQKTFQDKRHIKRSKFCTPKMAPCWQKNSLRIHKNLTHNYFPIVIGWDIFSLCVCVRVWNFLPFWISLSHFNETIDFSSIKKSFIFICSLRRNSGRKLVVFFRRNFHILDISSNMTRKDVL